MSNEVTFRVFRGESDADGDPFGRMVDYTVEMDEGMVVLDVIHRIQAEQSPDLACRWNCKAGKCGSCGAEVNGKPKLMCMTRVEDVLEETPDGEPVLIKPMQAFPLTKDLVTDNSWAYEMDKRIEPISGHEEPDWEFHQEEAERLQEFRSCIECMLCVNTCHVDACRTYLGAALGDVAVADAEVILDLRNSAHGVQRVHLEIGESDEEARAGELVELLVLAQNMAGVYAEHAFVLCRPYCRPQP